MNIENKVSAAYRLEVVENGTTVFDTGEVPNLITDYALTLANPFTNGFLCVGSGSKVPQHSDESLQEELSVVAASFDKNNATIQMREGKRYSRVRCYGELTGIDGSVKEVGFKLLNNNESLISRTLIRDGNGLQTEIPLRPEQVLKISYYVYMLIPDVISSGTVRSPYGIYSYEIRPSSNLTKPLGIFALDFAQPLGNQKLALKLQGIAQKVSAGTTSWQNFPEDQLISGTVNFSAVTVERYIERIETTSNPESYPTIYFNKGNLYNPEESDIGFTLNITWSRE